MGVEHRADEGGFTLVELAVVTLVLAVLIAIALPSILGFRRTAREAQTWADLTYVAKAQAGIGVIDGAFTDDEGRLAEFLSGVDIGSDTDASVRIVVGDIVAGDSRQVLLYARSVTGTWFGVRLVGVGEDAGRHTCRSAAEADMTLDSCAGTDW